MSLGPSGLDATQSQPGQSGLLLGIIGHRKLPNAEAVSRTLRAILEENGTTGPPTLISPLAEGADRLGAQAVLDIPGGSLRVVLPLTPEAYEEDFQSGESCREFRELLTRAALVDVLPPKPSRAEAYQFAGRRVVEECDLLLAVWDGHPSGGRGGTAETVAYARQVGRPMIIIDSNDPDKMIREGLTRVGED